MLMRKEVEGHIKLSGDRRTGRRRAFKLVHVCVCVCEHVLMQFMGLFIRFEVIQGSKCNRCKNSCLSRKKSASFSYKNNVAGNC